MRGEVVTLEAEATDPDLIDGGEIHNRERVDNGSAVTAAKRGVGKERAGGGERFQGSVDGGDRNYAVRRVRFRTRENIPWHSDGVLEF